jgi:HK97 family phage prohead protease
VTPKEAASVLPRKTFDCEFKELDEGSGEFELYALVFDNVDRQGDLIEQGAVTNVEELIKDGWIALNHDQTALPIAYIKTATQDSHGLKLTGNFHSTPDAQASRTTIKERMAAGKAVKTSIGYLVPIDGEHYEKQDGRTIRRITKLSVYEASYVNLPANPEAEFVSAKSLDFTLDGFEEEEVLMSTEEGVLQALKKLVGLESKAGRKMSGATLEKMKGYCKDMQEHGEKCMAHAKEMNDKCKSLKAMGEAHKAVGDEFEKCLKNFTSGQQQEEDEHSDGDVADDKDEDEEEEKSKRRKRRKEDAEEEDSEEEDDDEDTVKSRKRKKDEEEDPEEKALRAYQNELKRRALSLKYPNRAG